MAPWLLSKQVNHDNTKKVLYDKEFTIDKKSFESLNKIILNQNIDILEVCDMSSKDVKTLAQKISLNTADKSDLAIKQEIQFMIETHLAGQVFIIKQKFCAHNLFQGTCHNYVHSRGQTAGWTDLYCEHLVKIGAKFMSRQESVSDVSDIAHSLLKLPLVHICDDSCNYVR